MFSHKNERTKTDLAKVILTQDGGLRVPTQPKTHKAGFSHYRAARILLLGLFREVSREGFTRQPYSIIFNVPVYRTFYFGNSMCQTSEQGNRSFPLSPGPRIYNVSFIRACNSITQVIGRDERECCRLHGRSPSVVCN